MDKDMFLSIVKTIKTTGNKVGENGDITIYKNAQGNYCCIKPNNEVLLIKEDTIYKAQADKEITQKTVSMKDFTDLRSSIEKEENLKFQGAYSRVYEDNNGRIFRLEDDGYTEVLVVDGWVITRSYNGSISIEPIIRKHEEDDFEKTESIQITFTKEEMDAISKKTEMEILDKEDLYDAVNTIIADSLRKDVCEREKGILGYFNGISDELLIKYCKEISEFTNRGILSDDAQIKEVMQVFDIPARAAENCVISEAINRYGFLVPMLIKAAPSTFLK